MEEPASFLEVPEDPALAASLTGDDPVVAARFLSVPEAGLEALGAEGARDLRARGAEREALGDARGRDGDRDLRGPREEPRRAAARGERARRLRGLGGRARSGPGALGAVVGRERGAQDATG